MIVAVLADIHANLEALEAVLLHAEKSGAQQFYVLGDVVGYGVDPVASIYRLKEFEARCLLGNHDQAMIEPRLAHTLNPYGREALLATRQALGPDELAYLSGFPLLRNDLGAVFAHAAPAQPEDWRPLLLHAEIARCMTAASWSLGFVGHTHQAGIYLRQGRQIAHLTSKTVAVGRHQYLINPGSVGQPRDGDWRASFALWDTATNIIELERVEYPLESTQRKMTQMDWPPYLIDRLAKGE